MRIRFNNGGLFLFGGICYCLMEIIWRGRTHWSMALTGGACFLWLYKAFAKLKTVPAAARCLLGGAIITACEFVSGCFFNRLLGLKVWDYSRNRLNIKGQICPLYAFFWTLLCAPVTLICDRLSANQSSSSGRT